MCWRTIRPNRTRDSPAIATALFQGKPATILGQFHTLISKGADRAYNFRVRSNNTVQIYVVQSDGVTLRQAGTANTVSVDTWYHLVALGTAGSTLQVYINGTLSVTGETYADIETNTTDVYLGSRSDGWAAGYAQGIIGEVLVYNRALTPQEIENNYLATGGRYN